MTEIKIEKKKAIWPWIFLFLGLLALLLYFFVFNKNDGESETSTAATTTVNDQNDNSNTVAAYVAFINSDTNKMSLDHSFTNDALLQLTNATQAMADKAGYDVKADLDKAKEFSNKITQDPFETSHADNIRKASDIIAGALQNLQKSKFPALETEAAEVASAATAINPDVLTLNQKDKVKSFFAKAAGLLEKMNQ